MEDILEKFDRLFNPKSIAFIGASNNPMKWGFRLLHHLIMGGYQGKIYPVNPREKEILGYPVFARVKDLPGEIDLAIFTVDAATTAGMIRECVDKKIPAGVIIAAGFSELGSQQADLEEEVARVARKGGMILVGPNGQGIVNTTPTKIYCWMPAVFPHPGPVGIVSQSGNLGTLIVNQGLKYGLGISKCISSGNEADLRMEDYFYYFLNDPLTRIILAYIEGVDDGRRFLEVSKKVTKSKPVVVLKAGKSDFGAQAAKSHTGALSGSDSIFAAACRQAGILRVNTIEELFMVGASFLGQPLPKGRRMGILTGGGGWGVIAADCCAANGLEVARLSDRTLKQLKDILPPWWVPGNPVDLVAGIQFDVHRKLVEILISSGDIDALLMVGIGWVNTMKDVYKSSPIAEEYGLLEGIEAMLEVNYKESEQLVGMVHHYQRPILPIADFAKEVREKNYTSLIKLLDENILIYPTVNLATYAFAQMLNRKEYLEG
ncbi:MAG: CoA-binding protein [Deltaproteobacteria bacterium]|nr:MAG: CoA-binding protein [Deltaproteobacteria bacterium]